MIKLLVPLVEIYSNYQKRLQQADQEPQGKRSFERLREAVDPIPLTLATPPDRKEVNNATAIAA